jgi:hypothetical protein
MASSASIATGAQNLVTSLVNLFRLRVRGSGVVKV